MKTMHTRRHFLKRGLTVLSAATTMPLFLQRTVSALNNPHDLPLTQAAMGQGEQVLVVIQLSGGNDGLATVAPVDNDDYRKARPRIALTQNLLSLGKNSGVALHPDLVSFKELFDQGQMAVIQGVGYPNPNRSHFRSMEIWQTADPLHPPKDGWLGRYFDNQCSGSDPKNQPDPKAAVNIGPVAPLALQGEKFAAVSFQNPQSYQWFAGNRNVDKRMRDTFAAVNDLKAAGKEMPVSTGNPTLDFLERTALDAQLSSEEILAVTTKYKPGVGYPATPLGQQLQMVAQMIAGGLKTRVYYVSMGGFDTHTNEKAQHDRLMQTLSSGVGAFMKDLKSQGNDGKVVVMTFSEFGRRVTENASGGTDHGTAAPMFVFGSPVKGGVYGDHPSLRPHDLDQGDLRFHTDFRSVYATILNNWLKADSGKILGANFKTMPLLV
ncbi:MAG: DUF1501 domain-containing protein [Phycisphaerae bacterium]